MGLGGREDIGDGDGDGELSYRVDMLGMLVITRRRPPGGCRVWSRGEGWY